MEIYHVIESRNVSILCSPEFEETVLFTGTKEECEAFQARKLDEPHDSSVVEYFIQSEAERSELSFKMK